MLNLNCTPYTLSKAAELDLIKRVKEIEDRVLTLRNSGSLTGETLKNYYGEKKYEQVAESNAIEGSTLSVGETELAILKGVTITGHDPAYVRDAIALEKALEKLVEMARTNQNPTGIEQLHGLHLIIMGERSGGGIFRNQEVRIKGSQHVPPRTWKEVMVAMEEWESWSKENSQLPAIVRSAILHSWLAHIHPYIDGNGRASRAIGNLELVRAGYPPIIIRKKERERYLDALSESDIAGDIRSFLELILDRAEGALLGLEQSAKKHHAFDPDLIKIQERQKVICKYGKRVFHCYQEPLSILSMRNCPKLGAAV